MRARGGPLRASTHVWYTLNLRGNSKFPHVNFWNSLNVTLVLQWNLFLHLILGGGTHFSHVNFRNSQNLILVPQPK